MFAIAREDTRPYTALCRRHACHHSRYNTGFQFLRLAMYNRRIA